MQNDTLPTEDLNRIARLIARALNDVPIDRRGNVTLPGDFRDDVVSHLLRLSQPKPDA